MLDLNPPPVPPVAPVLAVSVDVGLGKTKAWRERVVPAVVDAGRNGILAVPRHQLGDEIVRDLAKADFTSHVYRGREADDPEQPGKAMCHEVKRVTLITDALGAVTQCACKYKEKKCESYDVCGSQKQRRQHPDLWIVPHQLLFRERPSFIPEPDSVAVDEAFWAASLRGVERPYRLWLSAISELREINVTGLGGRVRDTGATADLTAISGRVCRALEREESGRIRRAALAKAGVTEADLKEAYRLEWRRKIKLKVWPGMPLREVDAICGQIAPHNQLVARIARLWKLLRRTLVAPDERSPWLELRRREPLPDGQGTAPAVVMAWRDDIHPSWSAPTLVMDATMPVEIVRQFFPAIKTPNHIAARVPHTRVRQIIDRPMTAEMLIPSEGASERTNATRFSNVERVRRLLQVRAADVVPGHVLVVCQKGLEEALRAGSLPATVHLRHFNDVGGQNTWEGVALVVVIGRNEPPTRTVERLARALFGTEVQEIAADEKAEIRYPRVTRGIRLRDGRGFPVEGPCHPDPRVETVRRAICEAGLVQSMGRGRGVNRTTANPLQIDIVTNVVLPIEVDEVTTWEQIQPGMAQIMRARGAVPLGYADMAAAYPDLFPTADAARMTLTREAKNPEQTPIGYISVGVCSGFSRQRYRRRGARGPAGVLLFDPTRIEPENWLTEHLGEVVLLASEGEEIEARKSDELPPPAHPAFVEHRIRDVDFAPQAPARAELIHCAFGAIDPAWPTPTIDPAWWQDLFEERAAHREFDGGYPRREAERLAWEECLAEWRRQHAGQRHPICAVLF